MSRHCDHPGTVDRGASDIASAPGDPVRRDRVTAELENGGKIRRDHRQATCWSGAPKPGLEHPEVVQYASRQAATVGLCPLPWNATERWHSTDELLENCLGGTEGWDPHHTESYLTERNLQPYAGLALYLAEALAESLLVKPTALVTSQTSKPKYSCSLYSHGVANDRCSGAGLS
jgi:hypothetical protein